MPTAAARTARSRSATSENGQSTGFRLYNTLKKVVIPDTLSPEDTTPWATSTEVIPRTAALDRAAGLPRIRLHDVRHSYASAALKAGISPKVISERLGHSTATFTLQTYTHVIPGMDEAAADTVATLILSPPQLSGAPVPEADGSILGSIDAVEGAEMQSAPGNPGADIGSGGRI